MLKPGKQCIATFLLLVGLQGMALAGETASELDQSLFGGGGGYIHPYLTLAGMYDDNVFNSARDTTSDSALVISPGIWLAVPGTREKLLNLESDNLTPGGLRMVQDRGREFKRFQGYLHYGADLTRYRDVKDNDTDDQRLEGYFQFNLKGNLSVELLDIYLDDHNGWNNGISDVLSEYKSNLAGGRLTYTLNRFRLRGDYSNYSVGYDDLANQDRDRRDNKFAGYLYYKLSPKSSAFVEYDYLDISYDSSPYLDSREHHLYGGLRWRLTGKTMGQIKLGYLTKDFSDERLENSGDFVLQGWVDYDLSAKTRLKLLASRTIEEPDVYSLESVTSNRVSLAYAHKLSSKISANARAGYSYRDYAGVYRSAEAEGTRQDDEYRLRFYLDYDIQDWLGLRASYDYFDRDSSLSALSYTDNRLLLSITLRI
ncbi:outer membrane beta-barrel protein [Desulfogranum mediterraneum]|uniref:outer membrane beta-barrel protein n=1 Tax=Desulfogranum mediterraneum TaxID=160661 RepID=UPI00042417D3|nr:outer membrane beta-barrel protein [Desulfogranum mediterraneum]